MKRLTRDFIALFNAFWYRDFPIAEKHKLSGSRAEWTTHIGICVRSCADLLGFFTYFESGGRTDATIKDNSGRDVLHLEWEWHNPRKDTFNEIDKLRLNSENTDLSSLITYSRIDSYRENLTAIKNKWAKNEKPLLVFLITYHFKRNRLFENLETHYVQNGLMRKIRQQPALPWMAPGTRWEMKRNSDL